MSNARGDVALLGMIVDRSSFDDDELSRSQCSGEDGARRSKNGRVRRRLKWKPQGLTRKKKAHVSSNESIRSVGERSARSSKTHRSFHTFSSTETPVLSNKKTQKPPTTMPRPNYPDTFDGVATIDNEAGLVHSRMGLHEPDSEFSRSHTMPSRYDDISLGDNSSFDPYGDKFVATNNSFDSGMKPKKKQTLRALARSAAASRRNSRPPAIPRPSPRKQKNMDPPGLMDSKTSSEEMQLEESFPMLAGEESEPNRRIDIFSTNSTVVSTSSSFSGTDTASGMGLSPARRPPSPSSMTQTKPQVTPDRRSSLLDGKPPISPQHIAKPVPARVTINLNNSNNLEQMMHSTEILSLDQSPLTLNFSGYDSPVRRPYRRPVDTMSISFHDSPGSSLETSRRDDDSLSTREPDSPKADVIIISDGGIEAGKSLPQGYRMRALSVATDDLSGARRSPSPPDKLTSLSPRRRRSTGPVDVDQAHFLEAERNLMAIHQMAAEHLSHAEYEEALEVFEEILRGQRERYGERHYRVGTALHNIAIVHLKSKRYDKAIEVCREAVRVRKEALVPNHPDVAVSLAQLGVAHLECQQHREALIAFREALEIRREFLGPKHPKVGKILNNIGCALYELDEMEGSKMAFLEALEIQRETLRTISLDEEEPGASSNQALLSISSTLCNLGSIKLRCGEYEKASVELEEALLVSVCIPCARCGLKYRGNRP